MSKFQKKYDLDSLIETFDKHSREIFENKDRDPYDFILPKALLSMCIEIKKLKEISDKLNK